jgi:TPR repeat protein
MERRLHCDPAHMTEGRDMKTPIGLFAMLALASGCYLSDDETHRAWEDACNDGQAASCALLGRALAEGDGVETNGEEAIPLLKKGCKAGIADGCLVLGRIYHGKIELEGVERNDERARKYFEGGCDGTAADPDAKKTAATPADSCMELARMRAEGIGGKKDKKGAIGAYADACKKGVVKACNTAAKALEEGDGVDKDAGRAHTMYATACTDGAGGDARVDACMRAGQTASGDAALPFFDKACQAERVEACTELGLHHSKAERLEDSYKYFARACELTRDEYMVCQIATNIGGLKLGKGGEAVRLGERGCNARDGGSCYALAGLYISDESGLTRDREKSIEYMRKSCDYGYDDACTVLRDL